MKWCFHCKMHVSKDTFQKHRKQHQHEMNTDSVSYSQYQGKPEDEKKDYMICVLHQRKVPCSIIGCKYQPFGMIRKSYLLRCFKGILQEWKDENGEKHTTKTHPFFPFTNPETGKQSLIPIDIDKRTVTLMGVPIKLKF